jgi:plastocyanin
MRKTRSPQRLLLTAALATGALVLAACGGPASAAQQPPGRPAAVAPSGAALPGMAGMPGMPGMPAMTGTAAPAGDAGQAPVATDSVSIKDFAFTPATVTVKVGTTVTWTNADQDAHTVTSSGTGGPLRSTTLDTGATYRYTFTSPGRYDYLCTIHPFMTATVVVTP